MKFLYVGDLHERSTPPRNRKDNWEDTYNSKIEEIRSIAKKHDVKAILHGGDFFSKHKYDTEFLTKVLNRWGYKNYNEKLLEEGVIIKGIDEPPIISPIGNHDLLGSSLKSYNKTSLAFLENIGFITIANKERPLIFKENNFSVAITGGHYELDMDETKEPYLIDEKKGDYHIHIVHGMLTDHKWPEGVPHTTLDEVLHTKADLTIAGHDHKGFPLFEHEGKIFVNPGSPFRMGTDEIKRKPKVMLIEITEDGISTKYCYLKSAKPGEEVLDLTQKEKLQRKTNTLKDIKEKIKENSKTGASINDIIKSIAEESNLDEKIAQQAIDRVADKMSDKNHNFISDTSELTSPYYITSLELINFASHERTTFHFNKGLNVFVGATASGKTTCFRAFKWIYDDDGNSKRFIKKGEDYCEATMSTSHGYTITRFIHPKGKKTKDDKTVKNGYEIIYPDGSVEVTNTKGVEIVREILSYKKLNLESKEIDLNFLEQGASWFFIGDKYTTTDRAKMIGAIHQTHFVDLAIKDLEADNKRLNLKKDNKTEEINKLQEKIDSFEYLKDLKTKLELINKKKENLKSLIEKKDRIVEILNKRRLTQDEINKCDNIIKNINIENLQKSKVMVNSIKENLEKLNKILAITDKINKVNENIAIETKIINSIDLNKLEKSKEQILILRQDIQRLEKIQTLTFKQQGYTAEINSINSTMNKLNIKNINKAKENIADLKNNLTLLSKTKEILHKQKNTLLEIKKLDLVLEKLNEDNLELAKLKIRKVREYIQLRESLIPLITKRNNIIREGLTLKKQIEQYTAFLEKELLEYQELLTIYGKCPICNSKIDKIVAKQIVENKLKK